MIFAATESASLHKHHDHDGTHECSEPHESTTESSAVDKRQFDSGNSNVDGSSLPPKMHHSSHESYESTTESIAFDKRRGGRGGRRRGGGR